MTDYQPQMIDITKELPAVGTLVNVDGGRIVRITGYFQEARTDFVSYEHPNLPGHDTGRWYVTVLKRATLDLSARKCSYCNNWIKPGKEIQSVIYVNRGQSRRTFCSSECATYSQFSAEG